MNYVNSKILILGTCCRIHRYTDLDKVLQYFTETGF